MVNPSREQIYKYFDRLIFTDDLDYVKKFSHVDEACIKKENINVHSWRPYIKGFERIGSYGPTIGIAFINERDRYRAKKKFAVTPSQNSVAEESFIDKLVRKVKSEFFN